MLPNSLAVVNANDILPTNADGTLVMRPNSDLFYLAGVEQEESILLLYPDAQEENMREILFLRETNDLSQSGRGTNRPRRRRVRSRASSVWSGCPSFALCSTA